jgi:ATP-dependent DNA helicase RecG
VDFLLQKQGRTWDSIPFPNVDIKELENLDLFRKYAANSKRIDQQSLEQDDKSLIEKLRLFSDGYLKRAAILLFHENPEKYIGGAFIKIGFFEKVFSGMKISLSH